MNPRITSTLSILTFLLTSLTMPLGVLAQSEKAQPQSQSSFNEEAYMAAEQADIKQSLKDNVNNPPPENSTPKGKGKKDEESALETESFSFSAASSSVISADGTLLPHRFATAVQVDPHSGSANMSIPIAVPQGRAGIQPNISVNYGSSQHNGIFGVGWSFEMGAITRSTKRGVPNYDSTDTFMLTQSGSGGELVYDSTNDIYRPELESAFMKIEKLTNSWLATDRNGTQYYFGQTDASRQYKGTDNTKTFKWLLDRVEDVHGNYMTFTYTHDDKQVYPDKIEYTGNSDTSSATFAKVQFVLESRSDNPVSYISQFEVVTNKRVDRIDTYVGSDLQSRYEFTYAQSDATQRSLLTKVQQFGSDGATGLPPVTFNYQNEKGFTEASGWTIPSGAKFAQEEAGGRMMDLGVRVVDFNSDGFPDLVRSHHYDATGEVNKQVYLNTRNNGWASGSEWPLPGWSMIRSYTGYDRDFGIRFADMDGDGWTDLAHHYENRDGEKFNAAFLSDCVDDLDYDANWLMPDGKPMMKEYWTTPQETATDDAFTGRVFADVNGDGYNDYVQSSEEDYGGHESYLNEGVNGSTGFTLDSNWATPDSAYTNLGNGDATMIDINGDGLVDFFYRKSGTMKVYINNGAGWTLDDNLPWTSGITGDDLSSINTQMADINGDGLPDFVMAKGGASSGSKVYINTGSGWVEDSDWIMPEADFATLGARFIDANADGMSDFLIYYHNTGPKLFLNTSKVPDLLESVDNGVGATTTLAYKSALEYTNTFLPFPVQVVGSVTVSTAQGDDYVTQYDYADGEWNVGEREFRGFGFVKVTDAEGNYSQTNFLQDDIFKGRVSDQASYDSSDNLFAKTVHSYDSEEIITGVNFVFLERTDNFVYDGDTDGRRTATEFFYGESTQYGNLTKTVQLGEVDFNDGTDIGTDTRIIETSYHNVDTSTDYLIGVPKTTTLKDHNSTLISQSWFYYDGNASVETAPDEALLTKKETWAGAGQTNPETLYTYDAYGNLLTTTDPLGNVTTIAYDTTYHLFPLTTTNELDHTVTNAYYGVNSVPLSSGGFTGLWGQLKSTTDPNNQTGSTVYDPLGQLIKTISPLDSITYPTTTTSVEYTGSYSKVTSTARVNHSQDVVITTTQFIDGLGRVMQTKAKTEDPDVFVVSGQVEYDSRAQVLKQYVPYFTSNDLDTLDSIDTNKPRVTFTYDPMGRVTQTTNPDSTYSNVVYDDWSVTAFNENGHKQVSVFDAYGQLITREEHSGADGRSSDYASSTYALYATTTYEYDIRGNLTEVTDEHDNVTTITYDTLGRKVSMDDPDMGTWTYEYDLNGNLTEQTDAKNQTITFTYDALNRLTNKTDGADLDVDYTYDDGMVNYAQGRLTNASYGTNNETDFLYDQLGREILSTKTVEAISYAVERDYDALNRLATVTYPDDMEVFYTYNRAGQIEAVADDLVPQPAVDPDTLSAPFLHFKLNDNTTTATVVDAGTGTHDGMLMSESAPTVEPVLLLHLDGTNGSTTITDEMGHSPSAVGNAQLDTSKKKFGTASVTLDGNGDYISVPDSDDWNFGTGDWTIDFWVNFSDSTAEQRFIVHREDNSNYINISQNGSSNPWIEILAKFNGSQTASYKTASLGLQNNTWYHLAFVRNGSNAHFFVDGVEKSLSATTSFGSNDLGNISAPLEIGSSSAWAGEVKGNMDEVRVTKGTALWTSNFTPPDAPHGEGSSAQTSAVSTTGKVNQAFVLDDGDYYVSFDDALEAAPVNDPNLQAFMDFEGTDGSTNITDEKGNTINVYGNAQIDTGDYKFETSSLELDGSGDYIKIADNDIGDIFASTSSNITIDMWVNMDAGSHRAFVGQGTGNGNYWVLITQGGLRFVLVQNSQLKIDSGVSGSVPLNQWAHIALVKKGTEFGIYLDGSQVNYVNYSQTADFAAGLEIGALGWASSDYLDGHVDEFRISYSNHFDASPNSSSTDTFDVPTAAYGSETTGENALGNDTSGTFTTWFYADTINTADNTIMSVNDTNGDTYFSTFIDSSNRLRVVAKYAGQTWFDRAVNGITTGSWNHLAVVQDGTAVKIYLNGVLRGDAYDVGSANQYGKWMADLSGIDNARVGSSNRNNAGESAFFSGKIDDLRYYEDTALTSAQIGAIYNDGTGTEDGEIEYGGEAATGGNPTDIYVADVDYNAFGAITHIEYGNGVTTDYTYDSTTGRLTNILTVDALDNDIQDLDYSYDSAGNVKSIIDNVHTATQTFTYDHLNRLVSATASGSYGSLTFSYDEIGNLITKDGKTYTYGAGSAGPHAVTSLSDGSSFQYDANGNMTVMSMNSVTTEYEYDGENRLISVTEDSTLVAEYAYDGDGGRVSKEVDSVVTTFVGSLYEKTGSAETNHIFLGDQRIASITDGTIRYLHGDHLGGTNVTTDPDGELDELLEYKPFGEFSRQDKYGSGSDVANYYFTGQYKDDESGLYFYNARYYNPVLGRFITADTIVQDPNNPVTLNRYHYAGNNPVNYVDPDGHGFWKSFFAAVIGVVAAIITAGVSIGFTALAAQGIGAISAGAWAVGGAVAGATGAALNGAGWQGILTGAALGGITGGIGGWAAGASAAGNAWGTAVLGGMLAGGIANAAVNNAWADLAGGVVGGIVGSAVGMGVVNAKYGNLSDPVVTSGQTNQQPKQESNSTVIQKLNQEKGNPTAVAKGAEEIARKAADTQTVVIEELQIVKVGLTAEARSTSETLIKFSLKAGGKCISGSCESHDYVGIAAKSLYKFNLRGKTVVLRAAAALDVVPSAYVRSPQVEVLQNRYLRNGYYERKVRYEYGPK